MAKTVLILGDQLSFDYISSLGTHPTEDTVLMVEDWSLLERKPYHRKKIALVWSAMRHFRDELESRGYSVLYRIQASIVTCIAELGQPTVCIEPREQGIRELLVAQGVTFEPDPYWFVSPSAFSEWMSSRKQPRLEQYYRMVRQQTGYLMDGEKPVGDVWNFDKENR